MVKADKRSRERMIGRVLDRPYKTPLNTLVCCSPRTALARSGTSQLADTILTDGSVVIISRGGSLNKIAKEIDGEPQGAWTQRPRRPPGGHLAGGPHSVRG